MDYGEAVASGFRFLLVAAGFRARALLIPVIAGAARELGSPDNTTFLLDKPGGPSRCGGHIAV
jgi:hypothetical protein